MDQAGGDQPGPASWEAVAVEALDVGVLVIDSHGIRHVNPAAEVLLGTPARELVGRQPSDAPFRIFDESGSEITRVERDEGRMTSDTSVSSVTRVVTVHGDHRWLRARRTLFELDGRQALLVTVADVSAQRDAEEESRRAAERLQQILDAVDASVFVKDRAGRYAFVNRAFEEELGRSRDDVLGRRTADVAPDAEAAGAAEEQDVMVFETGRPVSDALRMGDRTFLTTKAPLRAADGRVEALVGTSTNITAQVRAAEAQAIAAAVIESSPEGIVTFDRRRVVTSVNPAAEALAGRSRSELVGLPIHAVALTVDPAEAADLAERVLAGESLEYERTRPAGRMPGATFVVRVSPVLGSAGEVVGGAISVRDVTRLRHVEAERLRMQHELEHVERLDSLGQLAGGVAHDFNNLLAAIKLTSEMLVSSLPADGEDQLQAKRIVAVTERAADLTNQLLVFARREEPSTEQVEVNSLVRQADTLLGRTLGEHIERRLELVDRECLVEVDAARLEQVVLNLAVNARDAMPGGGGLLLRTEVAVLDVYDQEVFRTRAPGPHVVFSVTDEGEGMPEEVRRQAFEPFFTTKPRGQGTGLGLATVYAVSTQAGGGTWIYSEPGRGTVVKVALPLVEDPSASADDAEPVTVPVAGRGRRVVVVEDEAALRDVAERLLVRAGYVVESFQDGTSLVEALPRLVAPDVLLTDVVLPGLSGPEAAERLRERFPASRVVFMSGYTAGLMGGRVVDGEVLSKPFSSATLVAAIERALAADDEG